MFQEGIDNGQPGLIRQGLHDGNTLFGFHLASPNSTLVELK
jgi:hypothetical protein